MKPIFQDEFVARSICPMHATPSRIWPSYLDEAQAQWPTERAAAVAQAVSGRSGRASREVPHSPSRTSAAQRTNRDKW